MIELQAVTCVIPTTGRPELRHALASVARQTIPVEAVVVVAAPDATASVCSMIEQSGISSYQVVTPGRKLNGSEARNLGIGAAGHPYIAFLDDDDWWHHDKLRAQLMAMMNAAADVATSSAWLVSAGTSDASRQRLVPRKPYRGGDAVKYLLRRPRLRYGHTFIQTSTLVLRTEVAAQVRWDSELARHQDWDFFIRLMRRNPSSLIHVDRPLAFVRQGSRGSVSRSTDWQSSLMWLNRMQPDNHSRNDFIASVVIRPALERRDWRAVHAGVAEMGWGRMSWGAVAGLLFSLGRTVVP